MQKNYRVQQARITMMKTENQMRQLESGITLESKSTSVTLMNALKTMQNQKANMNLAYNVSNVAKSKYEAGTGSNLELVSALTSFKEAEVNYYSALYNALVAKLDYEKAKGQLYTPQN